MNKSIYSINYRINKYPNIGFKLNAAFTNAIRTDATLGQIIPTQTVATLYILGQGNQIIENWTPSCIVGQNCQSRYHPNNYHPESWK